MQLEPDSLELKPNEPGLPEFRIRAKDVQSVEYVRQAWLKDIQQMKESAGRRFFRFFCVFAYMQTQKAYCDDP
ncbi:unnamed protein product [Gongylonema pulchrum]|uniref:PH domain-containing protein n=1 Tax=Gongylonema pulchrum TaxID=637853 RepID=A0A183D7G9_9BILA|nr:unnamed protein product [Gongylonema pulchrum]